MTKPSGLTSLLLGLSQSYPPLGDVLSTRLNILRMRELTQKEANELASEISSKLREIEQEEKKTVSHAVTSILTSIDDLRKSKAIGPLKTSLDDISDPRLSPSDMLLSVSDLLKVMGAQIESLRSEQAKIRRRDVDLEKKSDQTIIQADITSAGRRILSQMSSLLKMVLNTGVNDPNVIKLSQLCHASLKKNDIDFFSAIEIVEQVSHVMLQMQTMRGNIETEFMHSINNQLVGMHSMISKLMETTTIFERASDSERQKLLQMLNSFKMEVDESTNFQDMKKTVVENIELLHRTVNTTITKMALESRQLNRALEQAKQDIRQAHAELTGIKDSHANMANLVQETKIQAVTDHLTSLWNRAEFSSDMQLIKNRIAAGTPLTYSLIVIDIDKFKYINDTYGHAVGDLVLQAFSRLINDVLSEDKIIIPNKSPIPVTDYVKAYRMGGEEFSLRCLGFQHKTAVNLAEKIRQHIEKQRFSFNNGNSILKITASFGVATKTQNELIDVDEMYVIADKAMYQSKSNGRNRVSYFDSLSSQYHTIDHN